MSVLIHFAHDKAHQLSLDRSCLLDAQQRRRRLAAEGGLGDLPLFDTVSVTDCLLIGRDSIGTELLLDAFPYALKSVLQCEVRGTRGNGRIQASVEKIEGDTYHKWCLECEVCGASLLAAHL